MSKDRLVVDEVHEIEVPPKYKFVCHGCTETALESTTLMHDIQITCQNCGLQQNAKPENWVIL